MDSSVSLIQHERLSLVSFGQLHLPGAGWLVKRCGAASLAGMHTVKLIHGWEHRPCGGSSARAVHGSRATAYQYPRKLPGRLHEGAHYVHDREIAQKRTPTHDLAGAKKAERDEASSCQAKGVELGAEGT